MLSPTVFQTFNAPRALPRSIAPPEVEVLVHEIRQGAVVLALDGRAGLASAATQRGPWDNTEHFPEISELHLETSKYEG